MMTLTLDLCLAVLGAEQDDVSYVRLSVSNFYTAPDGTFWNSGAWQITHENGAATAKVRLVLEPQKGGTRRDLKGDMEAPGFEKLFADLKKNGLLNAGEPTPCLCDAPVYTMAAREGKTEHSFRFGHDHKDQDRKQRALIEGFIKAVEKAATEPSGK